MDDYEVVCLGVLKYVDYRWTVIWLSLTINIFKGFGKVYFLGERRGYLQPHKSNHTCKKYPANLFSNTMMYREYSTPHSLTSSAPRGLKYVYVFLLFKVCGLV